MRRRTFDDTELQSTFCRWVWFMAFGLLPLFFGAGKASAAGEVVVRVVFEFKDPRIQGQYLAAELPIVESEISQRIADACKERLRHWAFEPAKVRDLGRQPPKTMTPILRVWLSHNANYDLLLKLEGPETAPKKPWVIPLFEPREIPNLGLPGGDALAHKIVDRFRYSDEHESLLQKYEGDIRSAMQLSVPIVLGTLYRYLGPNPLVKTDEAVAVVTLDLTHPEYRELRYSEFLIRCTLKGPQNTEVRIGARANGQDPPQPNQGLKLWLWSWDDGLGDPKDLNAIQRDKPGRFAQILIDLVSVKCELIYLSKYVPRDTIE